MYATVLLSSVFPKFPVNVSGRICLMFIVYLQKKTSRRVKKINKAILLKSNWRFFHFTVQSLTFNWELYKKSGELVWRLVVQMDDEVVQRVFQEGGRDYYQQQPSTSSSSSSSSILQSLPLHVVWMKKPYLSYSCNHFYYLFYSPRFIVICIIRLDAYIFRLHVSYPSIFSVVSFT